MASEHKPGFDYFYSEILKQECAISHKTGCLISGDGVRYTPYELEVLEKSDEQFDILIHKLKKFFDGEVIEIEREMGRGGEKKPAESGRGISAAHAENTSGKIPGAHGISAENRQGELDIY